MFCQKGTAYSAEQQEFMIKTNFAKLFQQDAMTNFIEGFRKICKNCIKLSLAVQFQEEIVEQIVICDCRSLYFSNEILLDLALLCSFPPAMVPEWHHSSRNQQRVTPLLASYKEMKLRIQGCCVLQRKLLDHAWLWKFSAVMALQ